MTDNGHGGCLSCGHPYGPHVLGILAFGEIGSIENVPVSGLMFCPECDCTTLWSVEGYPEPEMPPAKDVAALRAAVLSGGQ